MATQKQQTELIRLTGSYNNALSNGDQKTVVMLAKQIKQLKEKMKS